MCGKNLIRVIVFVLMSLYDLSMISQNYNNGFLKENMSNTEDVHQVSYANKDISNNAGSDSIKNIGTRDYNALGDTLQWVAATASLPYTIYFENDPELATAAAKKNGNSPSVSLKKY